MAPSATELAFKSRIAHAATTLAVVGLCAGATFGATSFLASRPAPAIPAAVDKLSVVATAIVPASSYSITRRFIGQIEAATSGGFGFEQGGRIEEVLVKEGDRVAKGAILGRLDTRSLLADRAILEAELGGLAADAELAGLKLERDNALTERGFQTTAAQDGARLQLTKIIAAQSALKARIAGIDVMLDKAILRAPFDARIGERRLEAGQIAAPGQTVLELFEHGALRLRVGVPGTLASTLKPGHKLTVEHKDETVTATLVQVRPDMDQATLGRSLILELPRSADWAFGDTAVLRVAQEIDEDGFWAPIAALREGVRGSWSVMALEETPEGLRAVPAAVEVVHSDGANAFLKSSFAGGTRIIAKAPDRVAPLQLVEAQNLSASTE